MSYRPRESSALHPGPLMCQRFLKLGGNDAMVDHMVGEDHPVTFFGNEVAQHKIVCMVLTEFLEAANLVNALLPHRHRRSQVEPHPFKLLRHQNDRGHFNGHAQPFTQGTEPPSSDHAAIQSSNNSGLFVE